MVKAFLYSIVTTVLMVTIIECSFDIVIVCHYKDYETLPLCIDSIKRNVPQHNRIFVIGNKEITSEFFTFIHEDRFYQFVHPLEFKKKWAAVNPYYAVRAFWVFQQLLKLGAPLIIDDLSEDYLVVDSDILWMRPQLFVDNNNRYIMSRYLQFRRCPCCQSSYTHIPYINAYKRLLQETPPLMHKFSFICHHMIFNRTILQELYTHIEQIHKKPWYQAVVDTCDYNQSSTLSEYELYGNWLFSRHKNRLIVRKLREKEAKEVPNDYKKYENCDIVAAHWWARNKTSTGYPES